MFYVDYLISLTHLCFIAFWFFSSAAKLQECLINLLTYYLLTPVVLGPRLLCHALAAWLGVVHQHRRSQGGAAAPWG